MPHLTQVRIAGGDIEKQCLQDLPDLPTIMDTPQFQHSSLIMGMAIRQFGHIHCPRHCCISALGMYILQRQHCWFCSLNMHSEQMSAYPSRPQTLQGMPYSNKNKVLFVS